MARTKSKAVAKKEETPVEAPIATKAANGSRYQLDPSQVERAATALVAHMKKHIDEKEAEAPTKNLADDEDEATESDQPIFLSLTTKSQIGNSKSLKPVAMLVLRSHRNMRITNRI
jgi:ribosome biogenesis protein UTP30